MTPPVHPLEESVKRQGLTGIEQAVDALVDAGCERVNLWMYLDTLRQTGAFVRKLRPLPTRRLKQLQAKVRDLWDDLERVRGSRDEFLLYPPIGPAPLQRQQDALARLLSDLRVWEAARRRRVTIRQYQRAGICGHVKAYTTEWHDAHVAVLWELFDRKSSSIEAGAVEHFRRRHSSLVNAYTRRLDERTAELVPGPPPALEPS